MDLEGSNKGVRINRSRVRNKRGLFVLGENNLLGLFSMLSIFEPSGRAGYENLGSNFILDTTNKAFTEECI
jgi:hypothetical protein